MIKTILVVDDSPDVIYAIKHGLENLGDEYKVIGAVVVCNAFNY